MDLLKYRLAASYGFQDMAATRSSSIQQGQISNQGQIISTAPTNAPNKCEHSIPQGF